MKSEEITAKLVCFDCRKSFERNWIPRNNFLPVQNAAKKFVNKYKKRAINLE